MHNLTRWLPFLAWPRPSARLLRGEFIASLTVTVVMVPQSVAYAALAGMPLHTPVEVRARTVEVTERRSTVTAEATVVEDGTLVGETRAVFALIPRHRL